MRILGIWFILTEFQGKGETILGVRSSSYSLVSSRIGEITCLLDFTFLGIGRQNLRFMFMFLVDEGERESSVRLLVLCGLSKELRLLVKVSVKSSYSLLSQGSGASSFEIRMPPLLCFCISTYLLGFAVGI